MLWKAPSGVATSCFSTAGITTREQRKSKSYTKKRASNGGQRSEISDQRSEIRGRKSGGQSARGKKRFRLFDHPAKHSANLCTFLGQCMMLFRRDISALPGEV